MKPLVIASAFSIVIGLLLIVFTRLELFWIPVIPVVLVAALQRTSRLKAAMTSAAMGFAAVMAYVVVFFIFTGVEDRSANTFCDEFCVGRAEYWRAILMLTSIVASGVAVLSGLFALIFVGKNERATDAG